MRFDEIDKFSIDELKLDEGNYRFRSASDQRKCIEKIYYANEKNFRAMMKSLTEDDLGELLLVYQDGISNIVMDGNRRLAALKVLHNPALAPTEVLSNYASSVDLSRLNFDEIQAQVSNDKALVLRTVYERHGAGGGKSRIDWPAFGRARFTYDNETEELPDSEWKIISLLYALEKYDNRLTDYLDDTKRYKHEVFRRIASQAIESDLIPKKLFSSMHKKVKKTEKSTLIKVYHLCLNIFKDIEDDVITLSRKKGSLYADTENVKEYLKKFEPLIASSSGATSQGESSNESARGSKDENDFGDNDFNNSTNSDSCNDGRNHDDNISLDDENKANYGIKISPEVNEKISSLCLKLRSNKLSQLYHSITTVSLNTHPSLVTIGAWAFLESLASLTGKKKNIAIESWFSKGSISNQWPEICTDSFIQKTADFQHALEDIRKDANAIKHSSHYHSSNAQNLSSHFRCLEPLLVEILDILISENSDS